MKVTQFDNRQIEKLHNASMAILEKIGVHVPHEEMLDLFAEAGAEVGRDKQMVKIPEKLVRQCIAGTGKQFTLFGRDRSRQAEFGFGKRNYNTIAGEALWVDDDLSRRYSTLEDVRTAARLADALKRITIVGSMADPHELPVEYRCVMVVAEQLKNTTKPLTFWFHDRASAKFIMDLFTIVAGSEEEATRYPLAYPFLEPISPLRFPVMGSICCSKPGG